MTDRNSSKFEPTLTVTSSTGTPLKHSSSRTATELMLYTNLLQQEKLLSAAAGAFNNEKERIDKTPEPKNQEEYVTRYGTLGPLRDSITNYQNNIKDLLVSNNISATSNPSLYNMYVDFFDVADENLTSQRIDALETFLNSDDSLTSNPKFPDINEMREIKNRRRDTVDDDDDTPEQSEQPENDEPTDDEKRLANLRAQRRGESAPYPNIGDKDDDEEVVEGGDFTIDTDEDEDSPAAPAAPSGPSIEDLQNQLSQAQSEIEDWKKQVLDKQALLKQAGENLQSAMSGEAADEAAIARLRAAQEQAQSDLDSAIAGRDSATQRNNELQSQNQQLQEQLQSSKDELASTQEDLETANRGEQELQDLLDNEHEQNIQDAATKDQLSEALDRLAKPKFSHEPLGIIHEGHGGGSHDLNAGGRTEPSQIEHQDTFDGKEILKMVLDSFFDLLELDIKIKVPLTTPFIKFMELNMPPEFRDVALETMTNLMTADKSMRKLRGGNRPDLRDKKDKRLCEHRAMLPFLVIGLKLLFEHLKLTNKSKNFIQLALKFVAGFILGFHNRDTNWFSFLINEFPTSITEEFKRHSNKIDIFTNPNYTTDVVDYQQKLKKKYRELYDGDLHKDLEKIEGRNGIGIISMFKLLHKPTTLHTLSALFTSLEQTGKAQGLAGIVSLISIAHSSMAYKGQLDNAAILSNLQVVGLVKYVKLTETKLPNVDVNIMKNIEKPSNERGNVNGYKIVPKMNLETVAVYKNDMNDYQIVFRGTRMDANNFLKFDMARNALNLAGSPELFTREPYAKNYRMAGQFIQRIFMRNPRSVTIQGYSLGSIGALVLGSVHNVPTNVYNPILGKNEQTQRLFTNIKNTNYNNINIYYVPTDPIGVNLPLYNNPDSGINFIEIPQSKFFNAHSMNNFNNI